MQDELLSIKYGEINVRYYVDVGTGGMDFGQDFVPAVRQRFGKVASICDFAAGNGFIGFALLAAGLCDRLCLTDMNPRAIEACKQTIKENGLEGKVFVYQSEGLKDVPASEIWNLVVGNLPHYNGSEAQYKEHMKDWDPEWRIHKELYSNVSAHLAPDGSVMTVEDTNASKPEMWEKIINDCGLKFMKAFRQQEIRKISGNVIRNARLNKMSWIDMIKAGMRLAMKPSYPYYFVWGMKK